MNFDHERRLNAGSLLEDAQYALIGQSHIAFFSELYDVLLRRRRALDYNPPSTRPHRLRGAENIRDQSFRIPDVVVYPSSTHQLETLA